MQIFCLHGGLSPTLDTLDHVRALDRIQEVCLPGCSTQTQHSSHTTTPCHHCFCMLFPLWQLILESSSSRSMSPCQCRALLHALCMCIVCCSRSSRLELRSDPVDSFYNIHIHVKTCKGLADTSPCSGRLRLMRRASEYMKAFDACISTH